MTKKTPTKKPPTSKPLSLSEITPDQVECVYSGKPGCMCGCKGDYRYHPDREVVKRGGERRGYAVEPKDINLRQVKKVLGILQSAEDFAVGENFEGDGKIVSVETEGRFYAVYLRPGIHVSPNRN